jgi:hypothetical protein
LLGTRVIDADSQNMQHLENISKGKLEVKSLNTKYADDEAEDALKASNFKP